MAEHEGIDIPTPRRGNFVAWAAFCAVYRQRYVASGFTVVRGAPIWTDIRIILRDFLGIKLTGELYEKLCICFHELELIEQSQRS